MTISFQPFVILFAFAIYGLVHSWLASQRVKNWARRGFGDAAFERYYRFAFNLIGILTLLPILVLATQLPDKPLYSIPDPWRWVALAGQVIALILLAGTLRQTGTLDFLGLSQLAGEGKTGAPPLATDGFYFWVRHPLYSATMLFLWLTPTMTQNLFVLTVAISAYFVTGAYFEEKKLARYFGKAYLEYKSRTPMFLPWPHSRK